MKKVLFILLSIFALASCSQSESSTILQQGNRDNKVDVSAKLHEVSTGDILVSGSSRIGTADENIFIVDYKSADHLMHIFDSKTLQHKKSVFYAGQGPEEITIIGEVSYDTNGKRYLVPDHGKGKLLVFGEKELLENDESVPQKEYSLLQECFPSQFVPLGNDEVLGIIVKPTSASTFNQFMAKYNMSSGVHQDYEFHPEIEKQRLHLAVAKEKDLCVLAHRNRDLLILTDLNGNFIREIQGPDWGAEEAEKLHTFGHVVITDDFIIASYSGKKSGKDDNPDQLLVFDLEGHYLKTLEIGHAILNICYNEYSQRIFMSLNDEPQFVYLDIKDI